MSNIFPILKSLYPDQVCLKVSPKQLEQAWPLQQECSYDVARWTAYKNRLTLDTFLDWFQAESGVEEQLQVLPSRDDLPSIWEVVNGTAIGLGETRIVLIPEAMDTDEYEVQAEWVDIPSWAADYYLAVQVDPDDGWLRIWGYTTHEKLKQLGQYNSIGRTYSLKREELIEDLNVMWVAREHGCDRQAVIKPLPSLSSAQVTGLLEQLSQKTSYSPRLEVPFEEWGALLASDEWRQKLYARRMENLNSQIASVAIATPSQKTVELRQWLRYIVESGRNLVEDSWQTFEAIFAPPQLIPVRSQKNSDYTSPDGIASLISLLQPNQPEEIRYQAAGVLGEIGAGNPDAIKALTQLLQTAQDEETRWQAALSLGRVDPGNPQAGIKKARLIDLEMQLGSNAVALVVAIMPKADERIGVFLQVRSCSDSKLPPGLKLSVLTELGETLQEVTTRSDAKSRGKDKLLQLRFSPPPETRFCVRVTIDNVSVSENFVA